MTRFVTALLPLALTPVLLWLLAEPHIGMPAGRATQPTTLSISRTHRASKFEHQVVSIRHIQQRAAQLADRLRAATHQGVQWVGAAVL